MRDLQNESGDYSLEIDKVGVRNLCYPIVLSDKAYRRQHTVARISMYCNLPHGFRGTHMSRFVEILNRYRREMAIHNVGRILREMKRVLNAESSHLEMEFPYFIRKEAPISRAPSLMEYQCRFIGSLDDRVKLYLGVSVPVTTLCPCSKELSERGAHNQRAEIRVLVRFRGFLWIEDLIDMVESCGSSPVYALLKREDERFVTDLAYQHPTFVEDVARNVAQRLGQDERITWYGVEVESYESIHNHNAYAYIEKK